MSAKARTSDPKGPSAAVAAAAAAAAAAQKAAPAADKLDRIRAKAREARALELEIASLQEKIAEKSDALNGLRSKDIPDLLEEAGMDDFTLTAEGNEPARHFKLVNYYSASFPKDDEPDKQEAAFKLLPWLKEIRKHQFTLTFGKGDDKDAQKLAKLLRKQKFAYADKVSVHAQTLQAEIRRRFEDGKPLSPQELTAIGATVGRVVKIEPVKN